MDETRDQYDVVVVGGGPAGLSGALALARARRTVLVVDAAAPRNSTAGHVHNYLTRDGTPPSRLRDAGRDEVRGYGGEIVDGEVTAASRRDGHFLVRLRDGRQVSARRLLVTTGAVDDLPDLAGLADRWGHDVLHCPYCHGWEVRDRRIGVLATGPLGVHQANLWRQWSDRVLLLRHDAAPLTAEEAQRLAARAIPVVDSPVTGLTLSTDGATLTGVRLASGERIALDAVAVTPRLTARSDLLESLGLTPVDVVWDGHVIGNQIPADATGATAVPGVWVAGNVADVRVQVVTAAGAGLTAGAAINADLIGEETRDAVDDYRHRSTTLFDETAWEERYRSRTAVWSGAPNAQLVAEAAGLPAGRALDAGCGEGADAIWLAERGWRVTAVDLSRTALERAADHATSAGAEIAARIEWSQADLVEKAPAEQAYDLVTSHYLHGPADARGELFARLAAAVAPGGTLLIVGHHPKDLWAFARRMHFPEAMFTAEEVAVTLDPADWTVTVTEARPRTHVDHEGREVTVHDAVLVARRQP